MGHPHPIQQGFEAILPMAFQHVYQLGEWENDPGLGKQTGLSWLPCASASGDSRARQKALSLAVAQAEAQLGRAAVQRGPLCHGQPKRVLRGAVRAVRAVRRPRFGTAPWRTHRRNGQDPETFLASCQCTGDSCPIHFEFVM